MFPGHFFSPILCGEPGLSPGTQPLPKRPGPTRGGGEAAGESPGPKVCLLPAHTHKSVPTDGSRAWLRDTTLCFCSQCSQCSWAAGMGNIACVPQAPGGFRHSFRRKPSLKKEQNGKKKLPSFFGIDGDGERDTTTDKILQYIPGKSIQNQENQKENLDQRFPSLFKKGRRKTVVRNLGKIIYYSKVKFKFQHCQEVNDCYLELFQSHLYFQSVGSNGLTYQGLLPLKELNVCEVESRRSAGQEEQHAFRITGPLLNPLIVFCPTEPELKQWLYHLEKQIHLNGGNLGLPFIAQDDWKQSSVGKEELRWSVQNMPVQEWRGTQRESLGDVLCVSKVKLQHLPFQEQHERLLVLYPSTLVIVSEEHNGLYFKGELPLNAIQVLFEENEKTSFLIEGRLINSIRVICRSYEDYQEWLYCLKTAQFRNADSSLSGSESFSGSKLPHLSQFAGSGRGSLASDGRTNSWASGGKGTNTLTHLSQHSGSLHDAQSFMLLEEPHSPGYSQPLHCLPHTNWPSTVLPAQELRRGSSTKKPKSRCGPGTQDVEQAPCSLISQHPILPALYSEPYCTYSTPHRPTDPPAQLEMSNVLQCQKIAQPLPGRHWMEVLGAQRHPQLPADAPYLANVSSLPEEHLGPLLQPPDDGMGAYDVPEGGCLHRDSAVYHDYAELQSFQSELSYDNLWDAEGREPDSPAPCYEV